MFEKGNQWWRQRSKHGRDRLFNDPQLLLESCYEYFEKTDERTWNTTDWVGKDADEVTRKKTTPYSKSGLCVYLEIANWTVLEDLKTHPDKDLAIDFSKVVSHIENIIITQKIEGASVGAFSSAVVMNELGMAQKINHQNNGGAFSDKTILTVEQAKQIAKDLDESV